MTFFFKKTSILKSWEYQNQDMAGLRPELHLSQQA